MIHDACMREGNKQFLSYNLILLSFETYRQTV